MPHGHQIPVIGDIPAAPGAPGPGQGGAPAPTQGFGPRQRAKRLLRQGAGLQPASDVQPVTGFAPAVEALLNLQLAEGLLPQQKFDVLTQGPRVSEVAGTSTASRRPGQRVQPGRGRPSPPGGPPITPPGRPALSAPIVSTEPVRPRRNVPIGSNLAPGLPSSGEVVGSRFRRALARRPVLF